MHLLDVILDALDAVEEHQAVKEYPSGHNVFREFLHDLHRVIADIGEEYLILNDFVNSFAEFFLCNIHMAISCPILI